jgi:hypothetical protein
VEAASLQQWSKSVFDLLALGPDASPKRSTSAFDFVEHTLEVWTRTSNEGPFGLTAPLLV